MSTRPLESPGLGPQWPEEVRTWLTRVPVRAQLPADLATIEHLQQGLTALGRVALAPQEVDATDRQLLQQLLLQDARAGRLWRAILRAITAETFSPAGRRESLRIPQQLEQAVLWLVAQPWHALPFGGRHADNTGTAPLELSPWAGLWHEARLPQSSSEPFRAAWRSLLIQSPHRGDHERAASYWQRQLLAMLPEAARQPSPARAARRRPLSRPPLQPDALAWWRLAGPTDGVRPLERWQALPEALQRVWGTPQPAGTDEGEPVPPWVATLLTTALGGEPFSRRMSERLATHWDLAGAPHHRPAELEGRGLGPQVLLLALSAGQPRTRHPRLVRRLLLSPHAAVRLATIQAMGQSEASAPPAQGRLPDPPVSRSR